MKRRNGFTLTEILIALAIVGVLSAVAINTLRTRDMSEEYTAKRDKAIMNIEGVVHQAMFDLKKDELTSLDQEVVNAIKEKLEANTNGDYSVMRDGTAYTIKAADGNDGYIADLVIDVNGDVAPNAENQDLYNYQQR